jgi:tetratricopeptide (TPR) repeat protein
MQLNIEGHYADAEAMLRRELELAKDLPQMYGIILSMRETLATALIAQRKYSEAQMTYQRALDDIPPAAHTARRENLNALLYSLESVDDKAALPLALWGLERCVETFGEDEPTTTGFETKVEQLKAAN